MTFIKKMCILRQVKQGFSGDGKSLSGLVKIEQYGQNMSAEISVINFAPLASGEYYCLIADSKERTELLPLRGKSYFNIVSKLDIAGGFCAVVCFVKNEIVPIAYGVNGTKVYDWRTLVKNAVPEAKASSEDAAFSNVSAAFLWETTDETKKPYDDETIAATNYYKKEEDLEQIESAKSINDAHPANEDQKKPQGDGKNPEEDDDAKDVCDPSEPESDDYYLSVRDELDALFATFPEDKTLTGFYPHSRWVRVEENGRQPYLIGVIYEDLKAKYVCYALPTKNGDNPPESIAESCVFVPSSLFSDSEGFFVLFQSAANGECISPKKE